MRPFILSIYIVLAFCLPLLNGEEVSQEPTASIAQPLAPFTGKITRNKVRMRLQPNLDAPILHEFSRDDLLVVVGEQDEFYAVLPPKDTKAYVFRTFVLDNIVEGNRVNVRLEPALEAPVIAQLNNGDRIEGTVSALNSKWLEISPPASTRFHVCKEYVEKIGSPAMMAQIEKRRTEVSALLSSARLMSDRELHKNYQEMNLEAVLANLNTVIKQYTDFPNSVEHAKELLSSIQEQYTQKKISFLEAKALRADRQMESSTPSPLPMKNNVEPQAAAIASTLSIQPSKPEMDSITLIQEESPKLEERKMPHWETPFDVDTMTAKMAGWLPAEQTLFEAWRAKQNGGPPKDFYEQQFPESVSLKGKIEPYSRIIRNKPGDYLLVSPITSLPIAYLYSTRVDLQEVVGRDVILHAVARPNNNFAFPAYYIISVEQ